MNLLSFAIGFRLVGFLVCQSPAGFDYVQEQAPQPPRAVGEDRAGDERALRALVAEFTRAFNADDSKAVAALFTSNARIVTQTGRVIHGRAAIEQVFASSFRQYPGNTIEVKTEHVRFLGADSAIEEGTAIITNPPTASEPRGWSESARYSVAYVKRDGKWLQDTVRDYPLPESAHELTAYEHLQELEWLIGDWVDESDEAEVHTACRWSDSQSFLVRSFQVRIRGKPVLSGSQRIGWDPRLKQIRSWVFDSDGGFSESFWSRDGERWVIKTTGVLKDGRTVSATNVLTRVNKDTIKWASIDRTFGSYVLVDAEEITLVREPPQPRSARARPQLTQPERTQP
jgi:uncharacterized protein (TIGR02246 family)